MKENTSSNGHPIPYFALAFYCFFVFAAFLMAGCKAKKSFVAKPIDTSASHAQPAVDAKLPLIKTIKSAQIYFNTFSGKAKAKLDIDGSDNDVTLNIRIQRDRKIWISITAIAGIEAARVVITPDSIWMINRLQAVYLKKPFSYIAQYAGSQVNYKMLESILIGNAIPEALTENSNFQPVNGGMQVMGNLSGLVYVLSLGADNKVTQLNLNDQDAGQTLQVTNSAPVPAAGHVMPSEIDMSSNAKTKKILVNLHYIKQDFDQPLEFPFSIPSRYTPAE